MDLVGNRIEMKETMVVLCQGARNIGEFTLNRWVFFEDVGSSLGKFFEENKSSLSYVSLYQSFCIEQIIGMLQLLSQGSAMEEYV